MLLFVLIALVPFYSYSKPLPTKHIMSKSIETVVPAAKESAVAIPKTMIKKETVPQQPCAGARTVAVANNITEDMLVYKGHITGPHSPNSFTTYVNGTKIEPGATSNIPVPDNKKVCISCKYEFKKGWVHVKKEREKEVTLDPQDQKISVLFSWDHDDRIIVKKEADKKRIDTQA